MMTSLLPNITESTIILIVLLGYYQLVLQKQTFYNTNRFYLLGVMLMAQIIPLIHIEIPFFFISTPREQVNIVRISTLLSEINIDNSGVTSFKYWQWIYFTGIVALSIKYLFGFTRLIRLTRTNSSKKVFRIKFIFLEKENLTFSFFNLLFINPSKQNKEDFKRILAHEKVHIQQLHSLDLLLVQLFCIVNWFNPLAWKLKKAIIQNHEYIADRHVIQKYSRKDYFELLIDQSFKNKFSFTNHFACSNLKKRIIMMTKQQSQKCKVLNYVPAVLLCGILFTYFSCNENNSRSDQKVSNTEKINSTDVKLDSDSTDTFFSVDHMPKFPEGDVITWLKENVKYPAAAKEKGISGKVIIQFVVDKDGSLDDIKVYRGVDPSLDQEAIRLIKSMPKWKPGKQKDEPVRVSFTVPITFEAAQK